MRVWTSGAGEEGVAVGAAGGVAVVMAGGRAAGGAPAGRTADGI